jgi:ketosteroid isomerase-like protein
MPSSVPVADRLDIHELLARYAWALDTGDLDGLVACFTPDAVVIEEVFEDQIACADLVVLNKRDLLDAAGLDGKERLADLEVHQHEAVEARDVEVEGLPLGAQPAESAEEAACADAHARAVAAVAAAGRRCAGHGDLAIAIAQAHLRVGPIDVAAAAEPDVAIAPGIAAVEVAARADADFHVRHGGHAVIFVERKTGYAAICSNVMILFTDRLAQAVDLDVASIQI